MEYLMSKEEFLTFLAESLMYNDEPFTMEKTFDPLVFDSVGILMLASAIESRYGMILSLDQLSKCKTPGDVYELLRR